MQFELDHIWLPIFHLLSVMTSNGNQLLTKISGYLEKKGRLRIGSSWKKYWFVLEGRLLLYYRSKNEYEAISPCKGSINLCPPCTIKPTSATSCIFQIEGRATTFTLRAESRYEQERWMQALLSAIDQSKSSPSRLSHFRYSFDELPIPYQDSQVTENGVQRQNSMLENTSTPRLDTIGRLQLIGAHTYGGSLDTFSNYTSTPNKIQHNDIFKNKSESKANSNRSISLLNGSVEVFIENDQYSVTREKNSLDMARDKRQSKTKSLDQIRNRTSNSVSNLNDTNVIETEKYYRSNNTNKTKDTSWIRNKKIKKSESLYERVSGDSYKFNANAVTRLRRKSSNIYERISSEFTNDSTKEIKVNGQFLKVKRKSRESLRSQNEPEYSIPMNLEDHNKNSLIIDNEQYIQTHDNLNEHEYYKVDPIKELEELYEDPDALKKTKDFEPLLPPRPELKKLDSSEGSSVNSSINETKRKKSKRLQLLAQLIKSDRKNATSNQNTLPKNKRSTSFIQRILGKKEKPVIPADDVVYEVIDNVVEKPITNDVQMLQELQKILERRKNSLQKKLSTNDTKNTDVMQNTIESTEKVKESNGIVRKKAEDLDKEKNMQDPNYKVKDLIDKFNDLHNEDDILLRRKQRTNLHRSETVSGVPQAHFRSNIHMETKRDSEELTKLLEELSKVTNAPVLTPGVTTSLTTPIVSDDKWTQVVPIRYRRLSDPDYDIPRPHTTLQLQNRTKQLPENAIPATRFFGPVLSSADKLSPEPQLLSSMDPDSLETEQSSVSIKNTPQPNFVIKYNEKSGSISSYKSHNYSKIDEVIYLKPKSILFNLEIDNVKEANGVNDKTNKSSTLPSISVNEETFVDSLEPLTQSTHF